MPAPINDKIKLMDIVLGYSEAARQSDAEALRYWRICFRAFKQMGLNAFWEPKTLKLAVSPSKSVPFPPDFIQWCKIGQFNWGGELQTLRINNDLTTFGDDLPSRLTDIIPEIQDAAGALTGPNWFNGYDWWTGSDWSASDTPFGYQSRLIQGGEVTVDYENRVFVLDPAYQYQFMILQYIAAPQMDQDYAIPLVFEQAMHDWLSWQDIAPLPVTSHMQGNEKDRRALQYKASLKVAKKMWKPIRYQEWAQTAVENMMEVPKP